MVKPLSRVIINSFRVTNNQRFLPIAVNWFSADFSSCLWPELFNESYRAMCDARVLFLFAQRAPALSTAWLPWLRHADHNRGFSRPLTKCEHDPDKFAKCEKNFDRARLYHVASIVTSMGPADSQCHSHAKWTRTASVLRQSSRVTRRNWLIIATRQWKLLRPTNTLEYTHALVRQGRLLADCHASPIADGLD